MFVRLDVICFTKFIVFLELEENIMLVDKYRNILFDPNGSWYRCKIQFDIWLLNNTKEIRGRNNAKKNPCNSYN